MHYLLPRHERSQTRSLDLGRLLAVQEAEKANELPADLVAYLVGGVRGVKDEREHLEKLVEVRVKQRRLRLKQVEDCAENGPVFEVVVPERKRVEEDGQHLVKRHRGCVLDDHTGNRADSVVARVKLRGRCVWCGVEDWPKRGEDLKVLCGEVDLRVFNEKTRGEGGIALHFGLFVAQCAVEEVREGLRVGSNGALHGTNDL